MGDGNKHPCADCAACTLRQQPFVPSTLVDLPELVVVGEAPGADEAREGTPFVGQSGKLLRTLISKGGANSANCNYVNVVACRPPNNREPTPDEIKACLGRFKDDLTKADTTVPVLAVGKTSHKVIFGSSEGPQKMRGEWVTVDNRRVMPTWHPAYVLRKPSEVTSLLSDITKAINQKNGDTLLSAIEYSVHEFPGSFKVWAKELLNRDDLYYIVVDIETDQLQDYPTRDGVPADKVLCVAIATSESVAHVVLGDVLYEDEEARQLLQRIFDTKYIIAHNGKFDARFLWFQLGLKMKVNYDTMLAHYALDENKGTHGLKALASMYFGIPDYEEEHVQAYLRSRNDRYSKVPVHELVRYASYDVCVTYALYFETNKRLQKNDLYANPFMNTLMPASNALLEVEMYGIRVDTAMLEAWHEDLQEELLTIGEKVNALAKKDVNLNSPKQLAELLYDDLRMPQPVGKKIAPRSTNAEALAQMKGNHPIVELLRRNRRVAKIDSSYVTNLLEYADTEERVHASFMIHGTETGRLSARNPALQTIPRESDELGTMIRKAFVARDGCVLIIADYSQAELRVLAAMSGEPFLLKVYEEGRDLHTEAAVALFGPKYTKEQRVWCKMLNFSYAYGGNEFSFAEGTGMPIEAAREIVRKYDANMPVAKAWKAKQFETAKRKGYVESRFGRRRRFPLITRENVDDVRKASVNMPVQSGASDITLTALISLVNELKNAKVVLTVHDSILIECPENEAEEVARLVKSRMEDTGRLYFPSVAWKADVDIKKSWGDK